LKRFRGYEALTAAKGKEKIKNVCLDIDHSEMVEGGETLSLDSKQVGVVNSPCYSHRLGKSLALAHVHPAAAKPGTKLKVTGGSIDCSAEIVTSPIYDPTKARTHES